MNGAASGARSLPFFQQGSTLKITRLSPDALLFWEPSEALPFDWNDAVSLPVPGEPVTQRHDTGLNVASADGSADWIAHDRFVQWRGEAGKADPIPAPPNRVWSDPLSATGGW